MRRSMSRLMFRKLTTINVQIRQFRTQIVCKTTYYDVLNVKQHSTVDEIKRNYIELAKKYHPDTAGAQNEFEYRLTTKQFQCIQEAYSVLSDKKLRAHYDIQLCGQQLNQRMRSQQSNYEYTDYHRQPQPSTYHHEKVKSYVKMGFLAFLCFSVFQTFIGTIFTLKRNRRLADELDEMEMLQDAEFMAMFAKANS